MDKKTVLLYSGGMDSWLIDHLMDEEHIRLHIRLHTPTEEQENIRLPEGTIIHELDLSKFEKKDYTHLLPVRNLLLVSMASLYGDRIVLGSVAGSVHYDNGNKFAKDIECVLNSILEEDGRRVSVETPYCSYTKDELLGMYIEKGGDPLKCWEESFSCYEPKDGRPCMMCKACRSKIEAFEKCGISTIRI